MISETHQTEHSQHCGDRHAGLLDPPDFLLQFLKPIHDEEPPKCSLPVSPSEMLLVGRIEIPRIHTSARVAEGASPRVLRTAVGHVPWHRTSRTRQEHRISLCLACLVSLDAWHQVLHTGCALISKRAS
jgi:hypothetical protein